MHYYEKNVVEIKKEYTEFLINIMTPYIYEGMRAVYNWANETHEQIVEKSKQSKGVQSPGVLKIFQKCLKDIPELSRNAIEKETQKIKNGAKCGEWFDDLVKATVKSYIILLTFNNSKNKSLLIEQKKHADINVNDFVHKCYIETARILYDNPELFWHGYQPIEIKKNQRDIRSIIKQAIEEAIRKVLPITNILKEYLQNDYIPTNDADITKEHYDKIKEMVKNELHGRQQQNQKIEHREYDHVNTVGEIDGSGNLLDDDDEFNENDNENGFRTIDDAQNYSLQKPTEKITSSSDSSSTDKNEDSDKNEDKNENSNEQKEEVTMTGGIFLKKNSPVKNNNDNNQVKVQSVTSQGASANKQKEPIKQQTKNSSSSEESEFFDRFMN